METTFLEYYNSNRELGFESVTLWKIIHFWLGYAV